MNTGKVLIITTLASAGIIGAYQLLRMKQTAESLDYGMTADKVSYSNGNIVIRTHLRLFNPTSKAIELENCYVTLLHLTKDFAKINLLGRKINIQPLSTTRIKNIEVSISPMQMIPVLRQVGGLATDLISKIVTFQFDKISTALDSAKKQIIEQFAVRVIAATNGLQLPTIEKQLTYEP